MGWQVGRMANSRSSQSLLDDRFLRSFRIVKARYGPPQMQLPRESFAQFGRATSNATERTAVLVGAHSIFTRTERAISGQAWLTACGNGNLALQNSIRCLESQTAYRLWAKILTARSWSDGRAESTGSLKEKPKCIRSQVLRGSSGPEGYSAIATAAFGSQHWT